MLTQASNDGSWPHWVPQLGTPLAPAASRAIGITDPQATAALSESGRSKDTFSNILFEGLFPNQVAGSRRLHSPPCASHIRQRETRRPIPMQFS
jgi:hypothetical protein